MRIEEFLTYIGDDGLIDYEGLHVGAERIKHRYKEWQAKKRAKIVELYQETLHPDHEGYLRQWWEFKDRRIRIIIRDELRCALCDEIPSVFYVHHIDPAGHFHDPLNMITLCVNCHYGRRLHDIPKKGVSADLILRRFLSSLAQTRTQYARRRVMNTRVDKIELINPTRKAESRVGKIQEVLQ